MMDVVITNVRQIPPITADKASVDVHFKVLGPDIPDVVQVYANLAGEQGQLKDNVEPELPEQDYDSNLDLKAGQWYTILVCPRSKTNGKLDDQVDGHYWEELCQVCTFVTRATPGAGGQFPPPAIVGAEVHPATLQGPARIIVSWQAAQSYGYYNVRWGLRGVPQDYQNEVPGGSLSGSFVAQPVTPGDIYRFQVEGCYRGTLHSTCSDWSPTVEITASPRTHSLREFLGTADPRQGLHTIAPQVSSLRALMGL